MGLQSEMGLQGSGTPGRGKAIFNRETEHNPAPVLPGPTISKLNQLLRNAIGGPHRRPDLGSRLMTEALPLWVGSQMGWRRLIKSLILLDEKGRNVPSVTWIVSSPSTEGRGKPVK